MAKKKAATAELVDESSTKLHIEEIESTPIEAEDVTAQLAVISPEEKAKQEVARFQVPKAWVNKKKKEIDALTTLKDDSSKDNLKRWENVWREVRQKRLGVEAKHKEVKADYLTITQVIDGTKREILGMLKPLEDQAGAELDWLENEKKRIAEEKEREEQTKLQNRVNELLANGMVFNGSFYEIGEISVDVLTIKMFDDEKFSDLLSRVKKINEEILEAKRKEEQEKEAEKQRLAKQKEEQDAAQRLLDEQKAAMQKEMDDLKDQRRLIRAQGLEQMGYKFHYAQKVWIFQNEFGNHVVNLESVENTVGATWDSINMIATNTAEELKKKAIWAQDKRETEARERKERLDKRTKEAIDKGFFFDGHNFLAKFADKDVYGFSIVNVEAVPDADWDSTFNMWVQDASLALEKAKQAAKESAEKAEQERQANLSDAQKIHEFLKKFNEATDTLPDLTSKSDLHIAFADFIEEITISQNNLVLALAAFN